MRERQADSMWTPERERGGVAGIIGKAGILILGFLEALGMILFMGWDAI